MITLPKVVAILGPTASGKTDLAIAMAKEFNGEIVNFDSRQVYKEMDIGTAKPVGEWREINGVRAYYVDSIAHHLMDYVWPTEHYALSVFKNDADVAIEQILKRGHLPILCGGTGLYFWGVIDNLDIPDAKPNEELRRELESMSLEALVAELKRIDPAAAGIVDLNNPRRVVRAIESAHEGVSLAVPKKNPPRYDTLQIGLRWPSVELYARINSRVEMQIESGLIEETQQLADKYGWEIPAMTSIGYRQIGYWLKKEKTQTEAIELLKRDTRRYARRQMTWFKRDGRIRWVEKVDVKEVERLIDNHIKTDHR